MLNYSPKRFEALVARAIETLPPYFREKLQNVEVVVEPYPTRREIEEKGLLAGTELDWEQSLMQQGFKFRNPNEKTSCGCGHSFMV